MGTTIMITGQTIQVEDIIVFLSAGHGGSDPGAVGNGLKEKSFAFCASRELARKFTIASGSFYAKKGRLLAEDEITRCARSVVAKNTPRPHLCLCLFAPRANS